MEDENVNTTYSKPKSPPIPKKTKRNHVIVGGILYVILIILCVAVLGSILLLAGSMTNTNIDNGGYISYGNTIVLDGKTINVPAGFEVDKTYSSTDRIILTNGEDQITVYSIDNDSAKEYTSDSVSVSKITIGDITFYKTAKFSVNLNELSEIDSDLSRIDELENVTYYNEYVFDYNNKVYGIDIYKSIPNQKSIIQEILGI